eukprot:TRINITY_DN13875_c0_g1_i1.p1 TRINITY_DN13875_c0_g1~~TRINITY_DN13875_c0_g1_i1.p1  ORF type:complete len:247 (+),score=69.01 TRINITY_DN13875_c0_g1_i1:113-853(+)
MAWRSHGSSNASLIDNLVRNGLCSNPRVVKALRSLDRKHYILDKASAYRDCPTPIGHGQTISAPHMHAACLELLEPYCRPGMRVLDCGSGSGYLTAAFMAMVTEGGAPGAAFGIEYVEPLVPWSIQNLRNDGKEHWLDTPEAFEIKAGDGSKGWKEKGPFNAIHVGAAAPRVPEPLVEQLACPGRLVIPVGPQHLGQELMVIDKAEDGTITSRSTMGVRYVPFHMDSTRGFDLSQANAQALHGRHH